MLVIARRQGESVAVDGPAVVTVRKLSRGRVLLAIEAEPAVKILRDAEKSPSIDQAATKKVG